MEIKHLSAQLLKNSFIAGAKELERKKEIINDLNVFPVPDGDTGTNMSMTVMAAAKELLIIDNDSVSEVCKAISSGSLRGARGNSGVIVSQLFRGFTRTVKEAKDIDTNILAQAFVKATETAYKAVMKPKEGTILTVSKAMSDCALYLADETDDIIVFFSEIIKAGNEALQRTPELLPVLKEAGVVDSGGQGLMTILQGAFNYLNGENTDISLDNISVEKTSGNAQTSVDIDTSSIKYGYCTEFIIKLKNEFSDAMEKDLKKTLQSIGDSLVCVADDDIVKIHVHTNNPGIAIEKALTYGELSRLKIDNMREEHRERVVKDSIKLAKKQALEEAEQNIDEEKSPFGFVSVCAGDGLGEIFKDLGVSYVIEGGQTMNPSTDDILNAINNVNSDTVYILPNNKNIILAANQAALICENKEVFVIPTVNIPQGITAVINFSEDMSPEDNINNIKEQISNVKTISITYSVRDTNIEGIGIKKDDYMAIGDSGIICVSNSLEEVFTESISKVYEDGDDLVSVYYGQDIEESDAQGLCDKLGEQGIIGNSDIDLQYGGQPVYYYIISIE